MLPAGFREWVTVQRIVDDAGPFLARLAIDRAHIDLEGHRVQFTITAAGVGWEAPAAVERCWYEAIERVQASAPATVHHLVTSQPAAFTMPWWAFASVADADRASAEATAPLEGAYACTAVGMVSGLTYSVPASRVIPYWGLYTAGRGIAGECDGSGLAAAPPAKLAAAFDHGLREVLERDAIIRAWNVGRTVATLDPARCLSVRARRWLTSAGLGVELFTVGRPRLDPVVVALTNDGVGTTVGSACDPATEAAADRALLESLMLLNSVGEVATTGYRPPMGAEPLASTVDHVAYAYRHPEVLDRWRPARRAADVSPPASADRPSLVRRACEVLGTEPLAVRLMPRCGGPEVVRVLVPGVQRKQTGRTGGPPPHPFG